MKIRMVRMLGRVEYRRRAGDDRGVLDDGKIARRTCRRRTGQEKKTMYGQM